MIPSNKERQYTKIIDKDGIKVYKNDTNLYFFKIYADGINETIPNLGTYTIGTISELVFPENYTIPVVIIKEGGTQIHGYLFINKNTGEFSISNRSGASINLYTINTSFCVML